MGRIGIVTGMPFEAKLVEKVARSRSWEESSPVCRSAGIGGGSAGAIVRSLFEQGIDAVVSFGVAGGLDPDLKSGTIVLASSVSSPDGETVRTTDVWRNRICSVLQDKLPVVTGKFYCSEKIVPDAAEKKNLFEQTQAVALDMESLSVGVAAANLGMRFLSVKAIADDAGHALPAAIQAASGIDGFSYGRLAVSLIRSPSQVLPLIETGFLARKACFSLQKVCRLAGARMAVN